MCFSVYAPTHQPKSDVVGLGLTEKTLKHRRLLAMMHRNCNALGPHEIRISSIAPGRPGAARSGRSRVAGGRDAFQLRRALRARPGAAAPAAGSLHCPWLGLA
ncbi:hypothetical protein XFF6992_310053 [Xanthomonas citri pv. fuscans]|nr:hypothetical protein XFF6992_310053 [Xanthomonas citri pv. fuscans]SOO33200.1 hypothetical protein XFF6994_2690025 [Xanthomonas citri pv. fuscans]